MTCYHVKLANGANCIITGKLGPHCADCRGVGEILCDYPVGKEKTCDRPLCRDHATAIAPDIDYCTSHYAAWEEFRKAGGVKKELENIIAYKSKEKP